MAQENKIEIFEGDESYAFVMMTQALKPSVQSFSDVADLAIAEVRVEKANKILDLYMDKILSLKIGSIMDSVGKVNFEHINCFY